MAQAAQHTQQEQLQFSRTPGREPRGVRLQPDLLPGLAPPVPDLPRVPIPHRTVPLCAGCRAKEARYGFRRDGDDPTTDRPRTLCFECFRMELSRRQAIHDRLARGWNASQVSLPLEDTLNELTRRRRRAQIAARKALGV
jgi:hypothetical protein